MLHPGSSTAASRRISARGMAGCLTGAFPPSRRVAAETERSLSLSATASLATALTGTAARFQAQSSRVFSGGCGSFPGTVELGFR